MQTQTIVRAPKIKFEKGNSLVKRIEDIKPFQSVYLDWNGFSEKSLTNQIADCEAKIAHIEKVRKPAIFVQQHDGFITYEGYDPGTLPGWFADAQHNVKWLPDGFVRVEL